MRSGQQYGMFRVADHAQGHDAAESRKSHRVPVSRTHFAIASAKMAGLKRNKLEIIATKRSYLLIPISIHDYRRAR
jgi:hypothetical protein